jgi:hypothetical protein
MGLKGTRKLLSLFLVVIISFSVAIAITSMVTNLTFSTRSFLTNNLVTDELVSECESQLEMKYDALEVKSGIPARVFETVEQDYSTVDSLNLAVENIFTDETATLFSEARVDYFYNLCVEYLEGNNIDYDEDSVKLAAREAAEIYGECVGIHNTDSIESQLLLLSGKCAKIASAALVAIVFAVFLLLVLYQTRMLAYLIAAGSAAAGSIAVVFGSILCLITKVGSNFAISPVAYQQSFYSLTKLYFTILLLTSILFSIFMYVVIVLVIKKYKLDETRRDTRFSKIIGNF